MDYTHKKAFLSSVSDNHKELRQNIHNLGNIFVTEIDRPDITPSNHTNLYIADFLVQQIRQAEIFICVLGGKHGTLIEVQRENGDCPELKFIGNVSFFEIEIYQAVMLNKPIFIFVRDNFEPSPRLASLLEILEFALPTSKRIHSSDSEILKEIEKIIKVPNPEIIFTSKRNRFNQFIEKFYDYRRKDFHNQSPFRYFEKRNKKPDKDFVKELLRKVALEKDQEKRLTRSWMAIRELMSAPFYHTDSFILEYRPFWNEALNVWSNSAAWYGLHGHIHLGCLASYINMAECREIMRELNYNSLTTKLEHPGGALASSYYSIAKIIKNPIKKRRLFKKALKDLNISLSSSTNDVSNILAIRGSVNFHLGAIGKAVKDYEEVLKLRNESGADASKIGEALSELGFAYLFQGRIFKGKDYLIQGVKLLSNEDSGFLVRAKRKLSWYYKWTLQGSKARKEVEEAQAISERLNLLDQARQINS